MRFDFDFSSNIMTHWLYCQLILYRIWFISVTLLFNQGGHSGVGVGGGGGGLETRLGVTPHDIWKFGQLSNREVTRPYTVLL